ISHLDGPRGHAEHGRTVDLGSVRARRMAKRVLSGMQPSGGLHLGNLLGALDNFVRLQAEHECFYFIADWHALSTNFEDTSKIRFYVREMLIDWLGAGLDPQRSTRFIQSHVPQPDVLHPLLSML